MTMRKCAECGFLAIRGSVDIALEETPEEFRLKGKFDSPQIQGKYYPVPICFRRAINILNLLGQDTSTGAIKELIGQERECSEFTEWDQGSSPKEHAEVLQQKALLEYQRQREQDDREWRERQTERENCWRETQAERERQWRVEDQQAAAKAFQSERYKWWAGVVWAGAGSIITWLLTLVTISMSANR